MQGRKLDAHWLGPFTVCKRLPRGVYAPCSNSGQTTRAAGGQLNVYRKPNSQQASNQPQSPNSNMSTYTQSPSLDILSHTRSTSTSISKDCKTSSSDMFKHMQSPSTNVFKDSKWPSWDIINHTQSPSPKLDIFNSTQTPRRNVSKDCKSPSSPDKESIPCLLPPLHQVVSISYFCCEHF